MDPKSVIALLAIIISIISLYVSANVAWESHFKPAELKCNFPHMVFWTLSRYKNNQPTSEVASRHIAPSLWIGNLGAKSIVVADLRLLFTADGIEIFPAYPMNHIPHEAIESPSIFKEYSLLNLGGPFLGFSISKAGSWTSSYSFSMKKEYYEKLKGDVVVEVQVAESLDKGWKTIHKDVFRFGVAPVHLQGLDLGGAIAGASINHVNSATWVERRKKTGL